ncbi:hypothetical protein PILCRDRAFT_9759 [Piloderma croceum F 1598]|uniref:Uncharacterized protein n=1 Tax=Piloderma croceum (strain F 1598) TaxID=765440 RepID=A0A0C3B1X7_PILCF|nr:hypothetical protein PILCRDRAFT_9759 [Piloderma croceum F 1598]
MPRKAPAATDGAEPRRSSRIKDLPKTDPPKKAPAKPRAKKADGEAPKRGKKRAAEDTNGAEPPAKKAKAAAKPASKAAAKPSSKASAKPTSKASAKPTSRAGSKKPASKVEAGDKADGANIPATIAEETEA